MLVAIVGPMFSGKSEELIRLCRRAAIAQKNVRVYKPNIDTSTKASVSSRNGTNFEARDVDHINEIVKDVVKENPDVIAVDEAQFFPADLAIHLDEFASQGKMVIVAGLDLDYRGEPFPAIPKLLALADRVTKLNAICMACKSEHAVRTQRLVNGEPATADGPVIIIKDGDDEITYEARCRKCYRPPIAQNEWEETRGS